LSAFADMQFQTAYSSSAADVDAPVGASFDSAKAAKSLTELPHVASLEQSRPLDSAPSRDLGLPPRRDGSHGAPRGTTRMPPRVMPLSRIEFDSPALAPVSHTVFCLKYRDDCKVDKTVSVESRVTLTAEKRAELERI